MIFNILLFSPTHPRKNLLNQQLGVELAHRELPENKLHTNSQIKIAPNCTTYYNWLEQEEYNKLLSIMNLSLQIGHTESFCYAFAETMLLGIPTLCSPCVADNFNLPLNLRKELEVRNPDSVLEIKNKIIDIYNLSEKETRELSLCSKEYVKLFAQQNNQKLKEMLSTILNSIPN